MKREDQACIDLCVYAAGVLDVHRPLFVGACRALSTAMSELPEYTYGDTARASQLLKKVFAAGTKRENDAYWLGSLESPADTDRRINALLLMAESWTSFK